MPRKKFIAGNWKMYTTLAQAKELAAAVAKGVTSDAVTVAVCPPFPWLLPVADVVKGSRVGLGAQDCAVEKEGAFTGQVSAPMLLDAGCRYTIIGHSERRHGLNESDDLLNKKAKAALADGLVPAAEEIDSATIFATGFPPFRGGVLRYAETTSAEATGPPAARSPVAARPPHEAAPTGGSV